MSIKHALVVDDSKLAQITLKRQLEAHELVVALADSGEQALEFLEEQIVDVIFMDHTMPGMDGLQALAAIKRNPRTAMIPVMMYTTKEGEVYVGQARALGGIGVLPKEIHPQVLFDMLLSLGLVKDKRTATTPPEPSKPIPQRRVTDEGYGSEANAAPSGMALNALLNRIIEDQAALRTDLRRDRDHLVREVAAEVIGAQRNAAEQDDALPTIPQRQPSRVWAALTAVFAAATIALGLMLWQTLTSSSQLAVSAPDEDPAFRAELLELNAALHTEQDRAQARYRTAIDALQWSLNQNAWFAFDELPFDDARAEALRDLLERLVALGFQGRVRIESHLGEFCLVGDAGDGYQLATPGLPVEACTLLGHPQDDSTFLADRQSVAFAEFLRSSPLVTTSGITVELIAHDRAHSLSHVPAPPDLSRAGDWNRIAERNNRLEYALIPAS